MEKNRPGDKNPQKKPPNGPLSKEEAIQREVMDNPERVAEVLKDLLSGRLK
jgi:flagellar biosynthesis/type III secretory pathway M-ring protein FliF/YscJ